MKHALAIALEAPEEEKEPTKAEQRHLFTWTCENIYRTIAPTSFVGSLFTWTDLFGLEHRRELADRITYLHDCRYAADAAALRSDWERVGLDLKSAAVTCYAVAREQQEGKAREVRARATADTGESQD